MAVMLHKLAFELFHTLFETADVSLQVLSAMAKQLEKRFQDILNGI